MSVSSGSRFGPYEVLSRLGEGGMGEVYRARDQRLGREVAIKVLRAEYSSDAERLSRFEQEARAASALNHPYIVTIYDIGEEEGTRFIAMELVRGRTVRALLGSGPFPASEALDLALQAAEGLTKAHEAGIVHRDLKPENLMVSEDGLVKILDFGLAKLTRGPLEVDTDGPTIAHSPTRAGTLLGTVEYMSPEQASSRPVDFHTDHFSLGVVIYEMVTGERPFQRESLPQTLSAIIEAPVARLDSKGREVPPALADVVARCLSKKPEQRFATTRQLAEALRSAKESPQRTSEPPPPAAEAVVLRESPVGDYYVQTERGTRRMSEDRLRRRLSRHRLSGLEMVRREGEDHWSALHDRRVFREVVAVTGSPRDAARWHLVQGFGGHLAAFIGVGIGMTLMQGQVPFWLAFWGIGLLTHAFRVLPALVGLWREGKLPPGRVEPQPKALAVGPSPKAPSPALSPSFLGEVERVRGLLENRPTREGRELLSEIDRLVASVTALTAKEKDLEEQTSPGELEEVRVAEDQARAKLASSTTKYDRQLFQRQVEVLATRRRAIETARLQLDRMRVRRSMAEHQLKQLRLDLSQAEARRIEAPELSSRILQIRHEVDAFDEVEELLAPD